MTEDTSLPTPQQPKWHALVNHMVTDGMAVPQAAEAAGYTDTRSAYRALRESHVQEALLAAMRDKLKHVGPSALATLHELARSARSEKVRLEAALAVLDRIGITPPDDRQGIQVGEVNILIAVGNSPADRISQTGGVGEKLGVTPGHPLPPPNFPTEPAGSSRVIDADPLITEDDDG